LAATQQAEAEGYSGLRLKRRVAEIIQAQRDQQGDFTETGRQYGLAITFNNTPYGPLGSVAQKINQLNREYPWHRFLVPFTNIIANVVNESMNYTPVGSMRALMARRWGVYGKPYDVTNWGDQQMVADLHAKAALGATFLFALVAKSMSGLDDDDPPFAITGRGPTDASVRNTLRETGWIPNAIKIGNRYYSYMQTPAALPLATAGNYLDSLRYGKLAEGDLLDRLAYVGASTMGSIVDQSFLDSIGRLFGAVERPSQTKGGDNLADWAARTGSSFVAPNLIRQIDTAFDPAAYDGQGVRAAVLRQLPFARRNLRPVLNGLGEPVERPWQQRFISAKAGDAVWSELARLEVGIYPRSAQYNGEPMTDDEIYDLVKLSGPKIRAKIERLMSNRSYSRIPDKDGEGVRRSTRTKRDIIQDIINTERTRAKREVMRNRGSDQ
jgi:hypothetical protein